MCKERKSFLQIILPGSALIPRNYDLLQVVFNLPIPKQHHGGLLGKNGKRLQELEASTATKISIPKSNENSEQVNERTSIVWMVLVSCAMYELILFSVQIKANLRLTFFENI